MLKLLQMTDCHILPPGETIFESDPAARLAAAIEDINRNHRDAALCVLTGDLTHHGDAAAYAVLAELLSALRVPWHLVPGNHDDREAMKAAFPDLAQDRNGFLQSVRPTASGLLLFLDTVQPGIHSGVYCRQRLDWLSEILIAAGSSPVYLFMHHPPMRIAMPRLDQYRLTDHAELGRVLARHPNIRHIFCGHVHRPVSGSWQGIPFSALPGTNHQNLLDFRDGRENIASLEPPAYAVIFCEADTTAVHLNSFLDDSPRFLYDPAAPVAEQIRRL